MFDLDTMTSRCSGTVTTDASVDVSYHLVSDVPQLLLCLLVLRCLRDLTRGRLPDVVSSQTFQIFRKSCIYHHIRSVCRRLQTVTNSLANSIFKRSGFSSLTFITLPKKNLAIRNKQLVCLYKFVLTTPGCTAFTVT